MANKMMAGLKSRTVWTFIVLFIINGISGTSDMIPASVLHVINPVLTVLGIYFRMNPKALPAAAPVVE